MEEFQIMADGDFDEDNLKIEFFYLNGVQNSCPIEGCNGSKFASKSKFQRHWDEKHVSYKISYSCPVRNCYITCGRRTDLKSHLKNLHREGEGHQLEELLGKATKILKNNPGFVDPGLLVYKGRTKIIQTKKTPPSSASTSSQPSSTTVSSSTPSSTVACTTLSPIFHVSIPPKPPSRKRKTTSQPLIDLPIIPDTTPSTLTSRITLEEYKSRRVEDCPPAFDTHLGCPTTSPPVLVNTQPELSPVMTSVTLHTKTAVTSALSNTYLGCSILPFQRQDSGTQTTCLDYPLLSLPAIPEDRKGLENYLRWLCNCIDTIGRQREAAKERLEEIRKEGSQLDRERELRRKVEAENRRLRSEIAEMKWRKEVFGDTEQ